MSQSLPDAHAELYAALHEMLAGDPAPVLGVWSDTDDVTYAGPFGGYTLGRAAVVDAFEVAAAMNLGGRLEATDVHVVEGSDIGYSVCVEHGTDHVIDGQTVSLTHRATNVFRREADRWRLVHHHTDHSSS